MADTGSRWRRAAAVAGSFYPGDAAALRAALTDFQSQVRAQVTGGVAAATAVARKGAVCPHAGYAYAGATAFGALARCVIPGTVVVLGVNHRHPSPPAWSLWPEGVWETPLGPVPVDTELAATLQAACPELTPSRLAHERDHAIEVLLPMLQVLRGAGALKVVPITPFVARQDEAAVVAVGERIGRVVQGWREPVLIVASNDMTHFASAADAARQDRKALDRMETLDGADLLTTARRERITMCGAQPVAAMLAAARVLGGTRGTVTGYTHSGRVTGDDREVVAYAGMVID